MHHEISFLLIFSVWCSVFGSVEEQWKKFKLDFNKIYEKAGETHAFEVFKNNLQEIENHNKLYEKELLSYKKGITKFADLTAEEFIEIYKLRQGLLEHHEYPFQVISNSTEYLNWKDKGAVTKVKDQGVCGACWIFSAVGVAEGYYFRKNNKSIVLSEQNMIDCMRKNTCSGGYPPDVFRYLVNSSHGINTAEDYPYKGMQGTCKFDKTKKVKLDIHNYTEESCDEDEIKDFLEEYGPVVLAVSANGNWRLYESGIWFEPNCSQSPNHAVLAIGYGTENGKDYWLIKNSYGKEWGLNGYIKIARNIDENYCGIGTFVMFIEN